MIDSEYKIYKDNCVNFLSTVSDGSIDLIIADPPYGINYKSGRQSIDRRRSIKGEELNVRKEYFGKIQEDEDVLKTWIGQAYRVLKPNSAIYIFAHWSKWCELHKNVIDAGFDVKNMIVYNKSNHGMGALKETYAPKHELLLFATKGKHILEFPNGRSKDVINATVIFSGAKRRHSMEKPVSWYTTLIENSSKPGDVILDPFMGSASLGVAALSMKRKYIGIEIDNDIFNIAKERLEEYSKQPDDLF